MESNHTSQTQPSFGSTVLVAVSLLLGGAIGIALGMALGIRAEEGWAFGRRTMTEDHFVCLRIALHNYHVEHGVYPPRYITDENGKPMHSWRILILKYIDEDLYNRYNFDEPWNGPNNRKIADAMSAFPFGDLESNDGSLTNFVAVADPDRQWPIDYSLTSPSLAVVQVTHENSEFLLVRLPDSDIHWMEPRDTITVRRQSQER